MKNDRALRRNTFKLPRFESHASIFEVVPERRHGTGDRISSAKMFSTFRYILRHNDRDCNGRRRKALSSIYVERFRCFATSIVPSSEIRGYIEWKLLSRIFASMHRNRYIQREKILDHSRRKIDGVFTLRVSMYVRI